VQLLLMVTLKQDAVNKWQQETLVGGRHALLVLVERQRQVRSSGSSRPAVAVELAAVVGVAEGRLRRLGAGGRVRR